MARGLFVQRNTEKNSKPELYNQFLFCNSFLLFRQYLHSGQEDMFFKQEDIEPFYSALCLFHLP